MLNPIIGSRKNGSTTELVKQFIEHKSDNKILLIPHVAHRKYLMDLIVAYYKAKGTVFTSKMRWSYEHSIRSVYGLQNPSEPIPGDTYLFIDETQPGYRHLRRMALGR